MRSAITVIIAAVLLLGIALPADAAKTKKPAPKPRVTGIPRYMLTYSMNNYAGRMEFIGKILETQTGNVIASPAFSFTDKLQRTGTSGSVQWVLDVTTPPRGTGTAVLSILSNGREIEKTYYTLVTKQTAPPHNPQYDGEPISITFKNANLRDVLTTFSKLTSVQFLIDPGVNGTVNVTFRNVPWDEALDNVITTAGYQSTREGKKLHVHQ